MVVVTGSYINRDSEIVNAIIPIREILVRFLWDPVGQAECRMIRLPGVAVSGPPFPQRTRTPVSLRLVQVKPRMEPTRLRGHAEAIPFVRTIRGNL